MYLSLLSRPLMVLLLVNLMLYSCNPNESDLNKNDSEKNVSAISIKQIVNTENAPEALGPYNQSVRFGDMVFISGQIAIDSNTGMVMKELNIEEQSNLVLKNLQAILLAHGLSFEDVLKTTVFVTDMNDYSKFNAVYSKYFENDFAPARELVEVAALPAGVQVEISLIAGITK